MKQLSSGQFNICSIRIKENFRNVGGPFAISISRTMVDGGGVNPFACKSVDQGGTPLCGVLTDDALVYWGDYRLSNNEDSHPGVERADLEAMNPIVEGIVHICALEASDRTVMC